MRFSEHPGCNQWHSRGIYGIPYRCLYSRNIPNLFLVGRILSASHVAFGSSRVMATCAHGAQAVGMAAALCASQNLLPADLSNPERIQLLQRELLKRGQHILGLHLTDPADLARTASITASSQLHLSALRPDGPMLPLTSSWAQLLPVDRGTVPTISFTLDVDAATTLHLELRTSDRADNYSPDVLLDTLDLHLEPGQQQHITAHFQTQVEEPRYIFYCLMKNEQVAVRTSEQHVTGLLSVVHRRSQVPPQDIGVEQFDFWVPQRHPAGRNIAISIHPPINLFIAANICNGVDRPTSGPNAWVAEYGDPHSTLTLNWKQPQTIARLDLAFDTDFDHAMESVLLGHSEHAAPFCVKQYRVCDASEHLIAEVIENHQTQNTLRFDPPVVTDHLAIHVLASHGTAPAAIFGIRCYGQSDSNQ